MSTPEAAFRKLHEIGFDGPAHAARRDLCAMISNSLTEAGQILWVGGYMLRDKRMEGLALLTEMGAELASGSVELFNRQLWYAGGALVRQLVEVEYLMWKFAHDKDEPARWVQSSPEEVRRNFRPAIMRQQSNGLFRDSEYQAHCERGGHPAPSGRILLKDHSSPVGTHEWLWLDLVQHLTRLWPSFIRALLLQQNVDILPASLTGSVNSAIADWQANEAPELRSVEVPVNGGGAA